MNKKIKKHFFHSLYLFGYQNFLTFNGIGAPKALPAWRPYSGPALGMWCVFDHGPPVGLYADFPLLLRVPYAYKCDTDIPGIKGKGSQKNYNNRGKFIEFNESDDGHKFRGYCKNNDKDSKEQPYQYGSLGGIGGSRPLEQKSKTFIKNYIKIPRKDLAKFYGVIERCFWKSFELEQEFEVESDSSARNGGLSVGKSCKNGEKKWTCKCPNDILFGTCEELCLEDPPRGCTKRDGTKIPAGDPRKFDTCSPLTVGKKRVRDPDFKGDPSCGAINRWTVCYTSKQTCKYNGSCKLQGSIKYNTEDHYGKYDGQFKKIVHSAQSSYRYLEHEILISKQKAPKVELKKDLYGMSPFFWDRFEGGSEPERKSEDPRLFRDKWKFNTVGTTFTYDNVYGKPFKYLYSNTQDPLMLMPYDNSFNIEVKMKAVNEKDSSASNNQSCNPQLQQNLWYGTSPLKSDSKEMSSINIFTPNRKNSNFSGVEYKFTFSIEGIIYLKQKKEYVLFFNINSNLKVDGIDSFTSLNGDKPLGLQGTRKECQINRPRCPPDSGTGGQTPPLGIFSKPKCSVVLGCIYENTQLIEFTNNPGIVFWNIRYKHNHTQKWLDKKDEFKRKIYYLNDALFVRSYKNLYVRVNERENYVEDLEPTDLERFPETQIKKIPIEINDSKKNFEIEVAIPKETTLQGTRTQGTRVVATDAIADGGWEKTNYAPFYRENQKEFVKEFDKESYFGCLEVDSSSKSKFNMTKKFKIKINTWRYNDIGENISWNKNLYKLDRQN